MDSKGGFIGRRVSQFITIISDRNIPARGYLVLLMVILFAADIGEVFDGYIDGERFVAIALLDLDLGRG